MFTRFKTSLRTVAIIVAFICLGLLSQGGVLATELLTRFQASDLAGLKDKLMPIGVNLLIGLLFLSISYLFYRPLRLALQAFLERAGASPRGKTMLLRTMQLCYWLLVVFVVASVVAPDQPAMLIASDDGRGVYDGLGYLPLQRHTLWLGLR